MSKRLGLQDLVLLLFLVTIFVLGVFFRVYNLERTGLEVDEVSNFEIAKSYYDVGFPSVKPEIGGVRQPSYFHPVFAYLLMDGWLNITGQPSILAARMFNVVASMIALGLIFAFAKSMGLGVGLAAMFFVAVDGWIVLINRMNYLENFQTALAIAGVWLLQMAYAKSDERVSMWWWGGAGLALGMAVIFKHIGFYLFLVVIANLVLVRRFWLGHVMTLAVMIMVVEVYVIAMYLMGGENFLEQQFTQMGRVFGTVESRGLNYGPIEAMKIIVDRYWIFVTTVLALLCGWMLVGWRYWQMLLGRRVLTDVVLVSWNVGAIAFAVLSKLKSPHYLILWLVPVYVFIARELINWARGRRMIYVPVIMVLFLILNIFTWNYRFIRVQGDVLRDTSTYINSELPDTAVVGTESYIGALLKQPYVRMDHIVKEEDLNGVDYLAIYLSTTATLEALSDTIQGYKSYCDVVAEFRGFKDRIVLCRVDHDSLVFRGS